MRASTIALCRRSLRFALGGGVRGKGSWRYYSGDGGDGIAGAKAKIFDRDLKRKQRDRAAWMMRPGDTFLESVAENLLDRLQDNCRSTCDCKRAFPTALCFGGALKTVCKLMQDHGGILKLIMIDTSHDMVKLCKHIERDMSSNIETSFVVGDEEFFPMKERFGDKLLRTSIGRMISLGAMSCITVAQMEREGGISPRLSPLAQLIEHLRAMGETNALLQRNTFLKRDTALATAAVYQAMFGAEDGTVPATFQGGRNILLNRRLNEEDR
ncbi:putative methyltransferase, mitochondrial [Drosera capensis]